MERLVIIGNGIAGITTALEVRKKNKQIRIVVISSESKFHYSRPALMYIFMGHLRYRDTMPYPESYWREKNIELVHGFVEEIDPRAQKVRLKSGTALSYEKLVLATGSRSNTFNWPGQDLAGVQGLYGLHDLELLKQNIQHAKSAVIVGGGLIGIELGEMLHSCGIHVTFLIREASYWNSVLPDEESQMVDRVILNQKMDIIRSSLLEEILPDQRGRVRAVRTNDGREIQCEIVGLTPGVHPNISLAKGTELHTQKGFVVDEFLRTNVENIYACGDCAEIRDSTGSTKVESIWYSGKLQGQTLARNLTGNLTPYESGIFYNSAKFIDLEHQVYGSIPRGTSADVHYYWQSQNGLQSLRLVERDDKLIGVNLMGIRYRHRVCEKWIREGLSVSEVLPLLPAANFDPEFSRKYEPEIITHFTEQQR